MVNVIPLNDEREHTENIWCWCEPRIDIIDPETEREYPNGPIIVHNSVDCREVSERVTGEGVSADHKWKWIAS